MRTRPDPSLPGDKGDTGCNADRGEGFGAVPAAPVTSTRIGSLAIGAGGGGDGELREGTGSGGLGVALDAAATTG